MIAECAAHILNGLVMLAAGALLILSMSHGDVSTTRTGFDCVIAANGLFMPCRSTLLGDAWRSI